MTTHTDRIRQMAQEAGFSLHSFNAIDGDEVMAGEYVITEDLLRFAQLVAEDCARVCAAMLEGCRDRSEYDEYSPSEAQTIGWVDALNEYQERIRARYCLKD